MCLEWLGPENPTSTVHSGTSGNGVKALWTATGASVPDVGDISAVFTFSREVRTTHLCNKWYTTVNAIHGKLQVRRNFNSSSNLNHFVFNPISRKLSEL